jgi:hypothetical protein
MDRLVGVGSTLLGPELGGEGFGGVRGSGGHMSIGYAIGQRARNPLQVTMFEDDGLFRVGARFDVSGEESARQEGRNYEHASGHRETPSDPDPRAQTAGCGNADQVADIEHSLRRSENAPAELIRGFLLEKSLVRDGSKGVAGSRYQP